MQFAIVGYGDAGRAHGLTLRSISDVAIQCVVDIDPARAKEGAEALGAPTWSDNPSLTLRRADVDAVVVASSLASRAALAQEALDRGVHVFVEAPLALRFPDAQHLPAYARAADSVGAVNYWMRAAPDVQVIYGRIPRPTMVLVEAVIDPLHASWMGTARHGGVLGQLGSHALDLACFLMRSRPLHVQALGGRHTRRADLADTVAAGIRFRNGGLARAIVGEYGQSATSSACRVWATDGSLTVTAHQALPSGAPQLGGRPEAVTSAAAANPSDPPRESLRAFVDAVAGRGQPLARLEDGVRSVQLADAAYEAMGTRRRVTLAETPLHVRAGPIYGDDSVANGRHRGLGT